MTQAPQEVHALAGAVNQLLSAVRRSLGQEKRFLNDAAHPLRTPLAGLISQTELALAEASPQALRERLVERGIAFARARAWSEVVLSYEAILQEAVAAR
jgi:two-component system sensor histidine kinase TctE